MFIFLIALLLAASPAHAESVSEVNKNIKAVEETIKTNKSAVGDLSSNLKKTEAELGRLKSDTQSLVKKVKGTESQAAKLREKLDALIAERDALNKRMEELKALITPMLKAGLDMARTPADLTLFLEDPKNADRTLIGHVALRSAAQATQDHLIAYSVVRDQLAAVERDLEAQKAKLDAVLDGLSADRKALTAKMKERETLAKTVRSDLGEKQSTIKELTKKRERLVALLTSIRKEEEQRKIAEAARKRARQEEAHQSVKSGKKAEKAAPKASKRTLARGLPASGFVVQRFGEADADSGLASRGIRIEGEPGGLVTNPRAGEVRFTGPFKGFGNLVIIEHSNGDYTLLGGLGKTAAREGEKLGKGDPVGTLSASTRAAPTLYYELRHGGEPVDPLKLF